MWEVETTHVDGAGARALRRIENIQLIRLVQGAARLEQADAVQRATLVEQHAIGQDVVPTSR